MQPTQHHPENPVRSVFLVGVGEYKLTMLKKFDTPLNDLEYLTKALKDPKVGRCNSIVIKKHECAEVELCNELFDEVDKLTTNDFFMFYFSGYADISPIDGDMHLFLGQTERKFIDSLSFDKICRIIGNSKTKNTLIVLDCCFPDRDNKSTLKGTELEKTASKKANDNRITVIASTDSTRDSKTNQITNRSYFSEIFVDSITSGKADINRDQVVDHIELFKYIRDKLNAINPTLHPWCTQLQRQPIDVAYVSDSAVQIKQIDQSDQLAKEEPIGTIFSRWDTALVWDGVRNASSSVKILQTWYPGVEAEVARYGIAREDIKYKMLLIREDSEFVELRIRRRSDFSFLFGGHEEKTAKAIEKIHSSIRWLSKMGYGSCTQFYDTFVPGPFYIIDNNVYYGIFLPHIDAALTALHAVPLNSDVGRNFAQFFDYVWSNSNKQEIYLEKQDEIKNARIKNRLEQLEHDVSWLMYPGNNRDAPKLQTVDSGQILGKWNIPELLNRISNARRRVYIATTWLFEPKEFFEQIGGVAGRDFRILLPVKNSRFLKFRCKIIARNFEEAETSSYYENLVARTVHEVNKVPGFEVRYYDDFWHPGPIIIIDDSVFYGIYLRNENLSRGPMHVVSVDSNPGRTLAEAFDLGWQNSRDDYI